MKLRTSIVIAAAAVVLSTSTVALASPPPPWWCADGIQETSQRFLTSSSDRREFCSLPSLHCVTKDESACPVYDAPQCGRGERLEYEVEYQPLLGSDMSCRVYNFKCVTTNAYACPTIATPPCPSGRLTTKREFIPSIVGGWCSVDVPVCLSATPAACPLM